MTKTLSAGTLSTAAAVAVISAIFISAGIASAAGPWFVSPTGNDTNDCLSAATACLTINGAIAKASSGDTINVAAGTYAENVNINKTLTLKGAQAGVDARTRVGTESVVNGGTNAVFTITADSVTVDGFTLNGPSSGGTAAIVMQTANTGETIKNNIINNPGRAASITTNSTTFDQNLVNNTSTASDGFQANTNAISNLTISNNKFSGANSAIYNADITVIEGNSSVVVSGNTSTSDGTMIALFKTNEAQIIGNTIVGTSDSSAIYIGGANSNVVVSGNKVSAALTAVKVANSFGDGVNSTVTITGNTLDSNQNAVNVAAGSVSDTVLAHKNSLATDSLFGITNDPSSGGSVDGTCNWWGAANGPGPVGSGSGSPVSTNVTYQPWLTTSDLNGACFGGTPTVKVTIDKFVNGSMATAGSANSTSFPMASSWNAANLGSGSGTYALGPTGFNSPNAYEAVTSDMTSGASYSTNEVTGGADVGATCADNKPFALNGYSSGDSLAAAQAAPMSSTSPALTNITSNKYIIVWDRTCPQYVHVDIAKFVNGAHATAANANSSTFPMQATYDIVAENLGHVSGSDPYTLSPAGNNTPTAYEARTLNFLKGGSYATFEHTDQSVVGATCADNKPFALNGYSTGDTLAAAQTAPLSSTSPAFSNLQGNKYVIVWNRTCAALPPPVTPATACATGQAPAGYTLRNGTSGSDNVTLAPNTMFVGKGGNDSVSAGPGNYIVCTGSGNDSISVGAGQSYIDAGGANNMVQTGDGDQHVTTGSGNDTIVTAGGNDTINAGGGNNYVSSGAGNDSLTAGSGNDTFSAGAGTDTCNAGGGTNAKSGCEL